MVRVFVQGPPSNPALALLVVWLVLMAELQIRLSLVQMLPLS